MILKTRSTSPRAVKFSLPDPRADKEEDPDPQGAIFSSPQPELSKPPKTKKIPKSMNKINEKTSMSSLANSLIPQLNDMQKNFLGKHFFTSKTKKVINKENQ